MIAVSNCYPCFDILPYALIVVAKGVPLIESRKGECNKIFNPTRLSVSRGALKILVDSDIFKAHGKNLSPEPSQS